MTRREAERLARQQSVLQSLGFTVEEAESLRRISMTLQRWHELECGTEHGCVVRENEDGTGRAFWLNAMSGKRALIADRETGAKKRLAEILDQRNKRVAYNQAVCPNCGQWQREENYGDCLNECIKRGFAPSKHVSPYIQTDPRGAALYILRPGDVPAGESADAYYTRGICVY